MNLISDFEKDIIKYIKKFFNYRDMGEYEDALDKVRLFLEALCKLVIIVKRIIPNKFNPYKTHVLKSNNKKFKIEIAINDHKNNLKVKWNPDSKNSNFEKIMLGDLIPEVANIINNHNVIEDMRILRNESNKAHHEGYLLNEEGFLQYESKMKSLIEWLFYDFYKILSDKKAEMPPDVLEAMSNKPKKLNKFIRIQSLLKLDRIKNLLEKRLLYFTQNEKYTIQKISEELHKNKKALLIGYPAAGKTITAYYIAKKLKEKRYHAYCFSFKEDKEKKADSEGLWKEIDSLIDYKVLFIIDDCHLDIEVTRKIYKNFLEAEPKACLLFISRKIPREQQRSTRSESINNIFKELENSTFYFNIKNIEKKCKGIVAKYKRHYQDKNKCSYDIGDIQTVIRNTHKNLIILSIYMEIWEKDKRKVLSKIDKSKMLTEAYNEYFNTQEIDLTNSQEFLNCLLPYLCLSAFEIPFEINQKYEKYKKELSNKGLIVELKPNYCIFYHSEFAILLLQAFISDKRSRFKNNYKNFEDFLFEQIKNYLLSFQEYKYKKSPDNFLIIPTNILKNNSSVQEVFKFDPSSLLNKIFKDFEIKKIISDYFKTTDIKSLSDHFKSLHQANKKIAREIYTSLEDHLLINKIKEANFEDFVVALANLHAINNNKTSNIINELQKQITLKGLAENIEKNSEYDSSINALYTLIISKNLKTYQEFTIGILNNINKNFLIQWDKIKNTKIFHYLLRIIQETGTKHSVYSSDYLRYHDESEYLNYLNELVNFGVKNLDNYIAKMKLPLVTEFLEVMGNFIELSFTKQHEQKLKMMSTWINRDLAIHAIAVINIHCPVLATEIFKLFTDRHKLTPENKCFYNRQLARSFFQRYELGFNNSLSSDKNLSSAKYHIEKALLNVEKLKHKKGLFYLINWKAAQIYRAIAEQNKTLNEETFNSYKNKSYKHAVEAKSLAKDEHKENIQIFIEELGNKVVFSLKS